MPQGAYRFKMQIQSLEMGSFDNLGGVPPTGIGSVDMALLKQNTALKANIPMKDLGMKTLGMKTLGTKIPFGEKIPFSGFRTITLLNFRPARGQESAMFPWSSPHYAGRPVPQSGFFILVDPNGMTVGRWKFTNAFPIEVNGATTVIAFDSIERA